nr:MAG TPA: E3 ubiquitin-protein ligase [Caudoviricetes sp.]
MSMKNTTLDDLFLLESELFESDDVEAEDVEDTDSDELEESFFGLDLNLDLMLESDDADDDDEEEDDDDEEESEKLQEATFAAALLLDTASREDISQIAESYEDMGIMVECFGPVMEKVIVRLDRKARLNHLQKAAVFKLAAQAKDTKYRKLVTLWKMERQIEQYLAKKYGSKAAKVAREQIKNYTATGIKKVKSDPTKEVGKGRVANKVASKAINQAKASFSQPKK